MQKIMLIKSQHLKNRKALSKTLQLSTFGYVFYSLILGQMSFAENLSYSQAEQYLLENSYTTQASDALNRASKLQAEAVKNIGLPRVDLNVRAYKFHTETDLPLNGVKNNLEQTLSQGVNERVDQWQSEQNIPSTITDPLKQGLTQGIHSGIGLIPDTANVVLEDEVVRPTVSVMMPIYTGGVTSSTKQIANLKAERSQLDAKQQQDTQRFEVIQAYFNVQLQQQLVDASRFNLKAMQQHYDNALKLEKQGFVSKGQRMQFEVARNNALRTEQNATANLQSSQFQLKHLLNKSSIDQLTTPLFVNRQQSQSLNQLLDSYPETSSLVRKMQMDTQLANQNVKIQSATKKPTLFAFGEYSLDHNQNWIVGVAARYNLFSGIDKNKNVQAAEFQRYATELMTARTQQEIENIIYKSYSELSTAQQSNQLLQQNEQAALENLRIQQLSFKEDMGTASQVIDAQNQLSVLKTEKALNAYKYVMALATLLQSHGSISQFKDYVNQTNTDFIR